VEQTLSSTQHLPHDGVRGDADLISAVRRGDTAAYGELFGRHRDAAQRMARQVAGASDADDLVAESFARVLVRLQDGGGPDEAFRAYLLTSIRRLHIDRVRARNKVWSTAHEAELDRAVDFVDPAELTFEHGAAAVAFSSLPERWRLVLWHLDVEGQRPADVAPLLGTSANAVSALAHRAREGLRQAYLQNHLAPTLHEGCRRTTGMLGSYVRKGLSARDTAKVEDHLDGCSRCAGLLLELREVNSNLSGVLGPAVLGPVFAGYVAAGAGLATLGAGAATVAGAKLVAGGAAKIAVVPAKVVGAALASAGAQGVVAAAVVTGVATAGTVAVTTDFGRPSPSASAAGQASRSVAPDGAGTTTGPRPPLPTSAPGAGAGAGAGPEASPAAVPPAVVPPAEPTDVPETSPTSPEPSPSADPSPSPSPSEGLASPDPSPTPTPVPDPVVPTDYGIGDVTIADAGALLQRRFTIPVTSTTAGRAAEQPVTLTMRFSRAVRLGGVDSPGWDCGPAAPGSGLTTLTCSTTPAAGQGTSLVVTIRAPRPDGTISVTSPGDPSSSNDAVTFRAGSQLLLL
jgi:RNA polymerase sigma factor (sigma-70 family)